MAVRVTRAQRQAQTRQALLAAAREAFLEHGYERASLAQIADAAGCTTGAVYANFAGKDELFLAVLDARSDPTVRAQDELATADLSLEDSLRATARLMLHEFDDPRWAPLMADYWARAARDPAFRAAAAVRHDALMSAVADVVARNAAQHGLRPAIAPREIARGGGALVRGVRLERALGLDDGAGDEVFEEMFLAYVRGLLIDEREGTR